MRFSSLVGVLVLSAAFVPNRVVCAAESSAGLTKEGVLKHAKKMAKQTQTLLALADLLDELTKTKGELVLKSAGKAPVTEKTFFGVEFRVPQVEFEDSVTNKVFGTEVPGRRVSVKIWLDVEVECRIDV